MPESYLLAHGPNPDKLDQRADCKIAYPDEMAVKAVMAICDNYQWQEYVPNPALQEGVPNSQMIPNPEYVP